MNNDSEMSFREITNPLIINKSLFYSKHNKNYIWISRDNQGLYWLEYEREKWYSRYLKISNGYRNITPIAQKEKDERNQFHASTPKDLFYQFNNFYRELPLYITHFQIRKNLKKINQEIFYTKRYGIESFDLVTHKQQTLVGFDEEEANQVLCFDLKKESNGDYLICIGKTNSVCEVFKITYDDYKLVKDNKVANINPQCRRVFLLNEALDESAFINYITFIDNDRLISVSNDQCLRMYDLAKQNEVIMKIENESPINHCDINESAGIIACVGDCCTVDIFDLKSKGITLRINEHYDFGMVVRFNPYDNNLFATGNQDFSCRIWDLRKLDQSIYQLHGFSDSIGDLTWRGRNSIVYGENSLVNHVYDFALRTLQSLTYCGSLYGVVYDNQFDKIYCGVFEKEESGIMEYSIINHSYSNKRNYDI